MSITKTDLDKIENKVDKLDNRLDNIDKTLAINTEHLAIHIKRTDANEVRINFIEKHVYIVNAIVKIGITCAGIAGFALTILEIIKQFK